MIKCQLMVNQGHQSTLETQLLHMIWDVFIYGFSIQLTDLFVSKHSVIYPTWKLFLEVFHWEQSTPY